MHVFDNQTHRLRRLCIKSKVSTPEQAFALRSLLHGNIAVLETELEEACESFPVESENIIFHLKKLHVDVQLSTKDLKNKTSLFSAIREQLQGQIQKEILASSPSKLSLLAAELAQNDSSFDKPESQFYQDGATILQATLSSQSENAIDALLYYLHNGVLPWYALPNNDLSDIKKQLSANKNLILIVNQKVTELNARRRWVAFLLDIFAQQSKVFEALLNHNFIDKTADVELCKTLESSQIGLNYKIDLLVLLTDPNLPNIPVNLTTNLLVQLQEYMQGSVNEGLSLVRETFAKALMKIMTFIKEKGLRSYDTKLQRNLPSNEAQSALEEMSGSESVIGEKTKQSEILIRLNNAGLVLFHAYLPRLFIRQGWLDYERKIKPECHYTAAKALAYLCSGESSIPEHQATIIKVLLGSNIDDVLLLDKQALNVELIDELEDLTKSFISHWRSLGNTSNTALRSTFIQREAVLKFSNNTWQMTVERQAPDVLLDSLPFGLSTIKLPWMPFPLHLTW